MILPDDAIDRKLKAAAKKQGDIIRDYDARMKSLNTKLNDFRSDIHVNLHYDSINADDRPRFIMEIGYQPGTNPKDPDLVCPIAISNTFCVNNLEFNDIETRYHEINAVGGFTQLVTMVQRQVNLAKKMEQNRIAIRGMGFNDR